jgi:nucleoside-diphosphate-sugar epimerase
LVYVIFHVKSEVMEMTGILITGGGGFLGSHLAELYLGRGHQVICVDNFCTGFRSNRQYLESLPEAKGRLQFIEADVSRPWSLWTDQIAIDRKKISHVFHFASPASPVYYQKLSIETMWVNTIGLQEAMLFADANNGRVIFASTSEIYGDPEFSPQPESYWGNVNTLGPRSCYDEAKRFGEALLYTHNLKYKSKHGLVRIFNTYGPRMNPSDGRVIINFLVQAIRGEKLSVYGTGEQTRSFCYVNDLVAGVDSYARTVKQDPVNIGNDKEFTILELVQTVQQIFASKKLSVEHFPLPKDDPKQRCPDLTKARIDLQPWEPKVSLKEGLQKMADWLGTQDLTQTQSAGRPM